MNLIPISILLLVAPMAFAAESKLTGMFHAHHLGKKLDKTLNQKSKAKCDSETEALSKHAFNAEISCVYQCSGKKQNSNSITVSKSFNPAVEGMSQGDGYGDNYPLMASFTTIFTNWASSACLSAATEKCGSLEKVENSDYSSISSGTGKMSEKPTCEQNKRDILSPYDPSFKLDRKPAPYVITKPEVRIDLKQDSKASCKNQLKGKVCFGDCIIYDEKNPKAPTPLTLMTKEIPVFDQEEIICADGLEKQLSGKKYSKSVVESLCQNFYTQSLTLSRLTGSTCAAFRGAADCQSLVEKYGRK